MSAVFAKAGEPVTTEDGKVICYVKNDLVQNGLVRAADFHRFAEGERPWVEGEICDSRCIRQSESDFGPQICINGEWRP